MKSFHIPFQPAAVLLALTAFQIVQAPAAPAPTSRTDPAPAAYFRAETAQLASRCLVDIRTLDDWNAQRGEYRRQLFEMLGLDPLPTRGDLKAVVTGAVERDDFRVEKLHFQSSPGLYVTANLYLPRNLPKPAPAILYLCGHGPVISNGVSYGNKVAYQHHGAWFARNGYICLVLDTLQLGEIQGLHHGTHREGMWWWNARGYSPAGVEAWNSLRALDYLATRPEVDTNRFGATGRSGGGAYSWWIAALDDRIKAVAPVAGITDLQNHVVDGVVEGHCDCMFTVNTYRWDYPQVAALVAPRPLLIVNTDADRIFPLDGVQRTHAQVGRIYELHKAAEKLGLVIGPGPHKDTQDLQVPVFRWFNRHLKGEDPVIEMAATKFFQPQELKVFATLPGDAINTNVHETFVPRAAVPPVPQSPEEWSQLRDEWLRGLKGKVFRGWPEKAGPLRLEEKFNATRDQVRLRAFDFNSEPGVRLRLYSLVHVEAGEPEAVNLVVADETDWPFWLDFLQARFADQLAEELGERAAPSANTNSTAAALRLVTDMLDRKGALVVFAPRGLGVAATNANARAKAHMLRRYMLLGQTQEAMRVWDIRRACQALRETPRFPSAAVTLHGSRHAAVNALYAALFEPGVRGLRLNELPASHRVGPDYLNVLRVLDVPQAVAMVAESRSIGIEGSQRPCWEYPELVAARLGWPGDRLTHPGESAVPPSPLGGERD